MIRDNEGEIFAEYFKNSDSSVVFTSNFKELYFFTNDYLAVNEKSVVDSEIAGSIFLFSNLEMQQKLVVISYLITVIIVTPCLLFFVSVRNSYFQLFE